LGDVDSDVGVRWGRCGNTELGNAILHRDLHCSGELAKFDATGLRMKACPKTGMIVHVNIMALNQKPIAIATTSAVVV